MEHFKWKDEFSVNHAMLDRQHQIFLETLNKIYSRMGAVDSYEVFEKSLVTLHHYIEHHFSEEERVCADVGYPYLERQKQQHDFFRVRFNDLKNSYRHMSRQELGSLVVFMRDWFLNHILEEDRDYARFMPQDQAPVSS